MNKLLIPSERIVNAILFIRGQKVMLDRDLATLYGVQTRRLNEQVKRNIDRFPSDFMFQLTIEEKAEVIANCDHLKSLKFSRTNPHAFTEHGVAMLASILNTAMAIQTSIIVVRVFIQLRKLLATHEELIQKINHLEQQYDANFRIVFEALKQLIDEPNPPRRQIGFVKRNGNDDL